MPPVVAAIAWVVDEIAWLATAAAVEAGASAATAIAIGDVVSFVVEAAVTVAISVGLGELEKALAPKQTIAPSNQLIKNSIANRGLAYGRSSAGGAVVYIGENGPNNQYLNLVFCMVDHEIDAVEYLVFDNWILNFDNTGLNGGGVCTGETDVRTGAQSSRFANMVFCNFHLGVAGDPADASLIANSNGEWTSDCLLSGVAYVYLRITWSQNIFSAGVPNIYCVIRGKKVLDPRTATFVTGATTESGDMTVASTAGLSVGMTVRGPGIVLPTKITAIAGTTLTLDNDSVNGMSGTYLIGTATWSQNAALCYYDFHTDQRYGFRSLPAEWDQGYLTTAANDSDTTVPLANDPIGYLAPGALIYGPGIPGGTTITAVDTGARTVTMSAAASGGFSCIFTFSGLGIYCTSTDGSDTLSVPAACEAAYTINGVIDTGDTPGSISDNMLGAMAGACPWIGGYWYLRAGTFQTPTVSLSDSDLRGAPTLSTKLSRRDTINSVKGTYLEPAAQYEDTDFTPYQDASYISDDLGTVYWNDVQLPFTSSNATAQRLAKIICQRSRAGQIVLTMPCKLTALACQCNDNILVSLSRFGFVNQVFEVTSFTFAHYQDANKVPCLGVDLVLRGTDANVWNWDKEETLYGNPVLSNLPTPFSPAAPTGLALLSDVTTLVTQPDGTLVPRLKLTVTAPTDSFILNGGSMWVQFRPHGAATWTDLGFIAGSQTTYYITQVQTGSAYDVRVSYVNSAAYQSAWTEVDNCTVSTGGAAGPVPGTPVATAGQGQFIYVDIPAYTDSTIKLTKFYRATSSGGTYSYVGESQGTRFNDAGVTLGQQYFYKASSINSSNVESAQSVASNGATATQASLNNTTPPNSPSAPSTSGSGSTYTSGDGTVYAQQDFNIPSLPTGAAYMLLMFRVHGSTNWTSQGVQLQGGGTETLYQLAPNTSYDYGLLSFNSSDLVDTGGVVSGGTFTSAQKSGLPSTPGTGSLTTGGVVPAQETSGQFYLSIICQWAAVSDSDLAKYNIKMTQTDSDAATDYYGFIPDGTGARLFSVPGNQNVVQMCQAFTAIRTAFVRVQAVNRSGAAGNWLRLGAVNGGGGPTMIIGTGTISTQSQTAPMLTGLQVSPGLSSSAKIINAMAPDYGVYTTTGGTPAEKFYITLPSGQFSTKPAGGQVNLNSLWTGNGIEFVYDVNDTGNSATQAAVWCKTTDGTNLPASTPFQYGYIFHA